MDLATVQLGCWKIEVKKDWKDEKKKKLRKKEKLLIENFLYMV